jgi:tellurite resistance protein
MTDAVAPATHSWLEHFPVPFFAVTMGLAGLTLALHGAELSLGLAHGISQAMFWVTLAVFAAITAIYVAKALLHPRAVMAEWNHPVRLSFFPAISISLMLLGTAALQAAPALAPVLWVPGASLQFGLTLAVVSGWISARAFQTGALNPGWFIPAVGNVIAPIGGAQLGFVEVSWYFMAVGLLFWIVLLTLVMNRLMFHDPMPGRLQPSLVILIAPPAVAFTAWVQMHGGQIDDVARFLLNSAYFFTLLVALQLPRILKLPFVVSFWALGFPFAAVTIASLLFARQTGSVAHQWIGLALLAVLIAITVGLTLRTLRAILRNEIFVPE